MSSYKTPYVNALHTFYNDVAPIYQVRHDTVHTGSAHNLVKAAGSAISTGSHVLDLATGTGNVALAAAEQVGPTGRIIGVDISDEFLKLAVERAKTQDVQNFVEFHQLDVTDEEALKRCDIAEGSLDAITCGSAICMFPDVGAVVRLAAKLLRPGGVFAADLHGTHLPMKLLLDSAVPRGYTPPFKASWMSDINNSLLEVFEGSESVIKTSASHIIGDGISKWDVSTTEAVEKIWKNIVDDSPWATFGMHEQLTAEVLAEVKKSWLRDVDSSKNEKGELVAENRQYLVVAEVQ